jgi:catechol-2,3-dioxygenase
MLIHELKIYSSQLAKQVAFYSSKLGIKCIHQTKEQASFQLGSSVLTIESRQNSTPYHFAITIPSNKEHEALNWLKERVKILAAQDIEIHDFNFWNAKAMYFYDSDQNIVEFIARKNLPNENKLSFDRDQLLCISEIGLPTINIEEKFKQLNGIAKVKQFSGGFDRFLAIGDESGLFICVNKNKKNWFPTGDRAHSSNFELHFTNYGKHYYIHFEHDEIFYLSKRIE